MIEDLISKINERAKSRASHVKLTHNYLCLDVNQILGRVEFELRLICISFNCILMRCHFGEMMICFITEFCVVSFIHYC